MTEVDLERALRAMGERLRSEAPPDLSTVILRRLPDGAPSRRSRRRLRLAAAVAACALGLGGVAVAATPALRGAVGDLLSSAGIHAERVAALPPTVPFSSLSGSGLGAPSTAAAAEGLLGAPLPRSQRLGAPDRIFVSRSGEVVTLVWATGAAPRASIGALVSVARAREADDPPLVRKALGRGTRAELVNIGLFPPTPAAWIEGAPHAVTTLDGRRLTFRLAANVLVWTRGDLALRLEGVLDRSEAVDVAASFEDP